MFEAVPSDPESVRRPVEDMVLQKLRLENLRNAMKTLDQNDQDLIGFRFGEELNLEEIGKVYGMSKMAVLLNGS